MNEKEENKTPLKTKKSMIRMVALFKSSKIKREQKVVKAS